MNILENITFEESFTDNLHLTYSYAIKDSKVYKVYKTEKTYCVGNCLGKINVVVDDDYMVVGVVYPMFMYGNGFEIIAGEQIARWKEKLKMIENYENTTN